MDALILTALSKELGKKAKKVRGDLKPGEHEIEGEVTLAYQGIVNVLVDEKYIPTVDIPLKVALALFVRYAGITREAAIEALIKAMTKALEIEKLKGKERERAIEAIREIADLDAAEKTVRDGLEKLPEKTRAGKVIAKVEVKAKEVDRLEEAA